MLKIFYSHWILLKVARHLRVSEYHSLLSTWYYICHLQSLLRADFYCCHCRLFSMVWEFVLLCLECDSIPYKIVIFCGLWFMDLVKPDHWKSGRRKIWDFCMFTFLNISYKISPEDQTSQWLTQYDSNKKNSFSCQHCLIVIL